jgi:hypothetical protein
MTISRFEQLLRLESILENVNGLPSLNDDLGAILKDWYFYQKF